MNLVRVCCVLLLAVFALTGCETVSEYWKDTKRFYGEYVNPPATLDLDAVGECDPEEARLAKSFSEMDYQLFALERAFDSCPIPPSGEWVSQIMQRFPWLSGITAVAPNGTILDQVMQNPMKQLDFRPLLEVPDGRRHGDLRSYVQETPFGPEVYLAIPIFSGSDFVGLLTTSFDFREVLKFSTNKDELVVMSPETVLWTGRYGKENSILAEDWTSILRNKFCGTIGSSGAEFFWVVRYFANQPLIFAVPVDENYMTAQ